MKFASEICVFTNDNIRSETVGEKQENALDVTLPAANDENTKEKGDEA